MSSYLYEGNYVVCTHHVGTDYRKLQIDKNRRVQSSVLLGSKEKVLLVEIDIVIDEDFKCKTQWNSVVSNPELAEQMQKDKDIFSNKNGTRQGANNTSNHQKAIGKYNSRVKWNRAKNTFSIVSKVALFGGNYLGEMARDIAASYAIKDINLYYFYD